MSTAEQKKLLLSEVRADHDLLVARAGENFDRNKALFEENEQIVKNTFNMCQGLSLKNRGVFLGAEGKERIHIARKDIEHNGEMTARYFVLTENNTEYAEITQAGVYLYDGNPTKETITHEHKLQNAREVQSLVNKIITKVSW